MRSVPSPQSLFAAVSTALGDERREDEEETNYTETCGQVEPAVGGKDLLNHSLPLFIQLER